MKIKTIILILVAAMTLTMQTAFGQGIIPSNWRNEQTGDWVIGFYDDFAIYDCKFWNYKEKTQSGDSFKFVLESDGKQITVTVDNTEHNIRNITINGNKAAYSVIMGETLPDYPSKDTRTGFKDSHYTIDTVTLVGWLRDMPKRMKRNCKSVRIIYQDILLDEHVESSEQIDAQGRFMAKIPILNTTQAYLVWGDNSCRLVLEPGETYFFLNDFNAKQQLFMGDESRLQNEILSYPASRIRTELADGSDQAAALKFFEKIKQEKAGLLSDLNKRVAAHPTLSQRYIDYLTEYYNAEEMYEVMQGRFCVKDYELPFEMMDYAGQYWKNYKQPSTLCRSFGMFKRDYLDQLRHNRYCVKNSQSSHSYIVMVEEIHPQILRLYRDKGKVAITDDELKFLDDYAAYHRYTSEKGWNAVDEATKSKWSGSYEKLQAILERADISPLVCLPMVDLFMTLNVLDSVGCDKDLRDMIIATELYQSIDHYRQPLNEATMQFFEETVSLPAAKDFLRGQRSKYIAIQNKDIDNNPSIKTSVALENMSDGEQLLRKITEPYRGRLILLDVWGTWCAGCRMLLAKSQEEYERLKEYDLVYLYLCNRSSDKSWKNVIKQYNLTGDNIVHYNLPPDMQNAIERFLGVTTFPTYKLIDRNGDVLNVNVNPSDLESLAKLLEQMK